MKKISSVFLALLVIFCLVWVIKPKTIIDNTIPVVDESGAWWLSGNGEKISVNEEWILDPEIPENYVPVPGEKEVYMVIGENGEITQYRKRTQGKDGSWIWDTIKNIAMDINPTEIEDIFEIKTNNTTEYLKYIRNEDNSFAFVESDKDGNIIGFDVPVSNKIPENYIKIKGNIYAVIDENGVIICYKEKIVDENGNITWKNVGRPESAPNVQTGSFTTKKPETVPSIPLTTTTSSQTLPSWTLPPLTTSNKNETDKPSPNSKPETSVTTKPFTPPSTSDTNNSSTPNDTPDGSYTETETTTEFKIVGEYKVKYETKIIKTYNKNGELLSTKKEGPKEVSREKIIFEESEKPDKNKVESTLKNEFIRMSEKVTYETELMNEIFTLLNKERKDNGINTLSMNSNSEAMMIAKIFAADMALYNHADEISPLYGTLNDLIVKYKVNAEYSSSNIWKCTPKNAEQIHTRLQTLQNSKDIRMNKQFKDVGIAVVEKNGYYYIIELFIG